ncbi:MAG: hypothetical protein ACXABY_27290 [Candidatus Thorarchaeota archaeon]
MKIGKNALGIILVSFLFLILISHIVSSGSAAAIVTPSFDSSETGPSIAWHPEPNVTLAMDGAYTSQTQEIFDYWVWVNDSLGVDSVIFRFKWSYDEVWRNRTTVLVEGNETLGRYRGNLTWPAPGGGVFQFKVFANNTSGYWNETSPMTVHFGYLYFPFYYIPQFWLIVTCILLVPPLTFVTVRRLKHRVSGRYRIFRRLQDGENEPLVKLMVVGIMVVYGIHIASDYAIDDQRVWSWNSRTQCKLDGDRRIVLSPASSAKDVELKISFSEDRSLPLTCPVWSTLSSFLLIFE